MRNASSSIRSAAFLCLCLILAGHGETAHASIVREFYRGAGPLAMGNAQVAIADDENAIFYNPAAVAGYQDMTLHLMKIDLATSGDTLTAQDSAKALKDPSGPALNQLMGKNLYVQGTGSSFLTMPNIGIGAFYDGQAYLSPLNQAFPKLDFGYQTTSAVQLAIGVSSKPAPSSGRREKRGRGKKDRVDRTATQQSEWRGGVALKYVRRQGGFKTIPISQLVSIGGKDDLMKLVGQSGSGYGVDLGVQRVHRYNPTTTLYFGAAATNLGDVAIGNGSDSVKSIVSAGIGAGFDLGVGTLTLAYDLRHLTREDDWRKRQHLGARFSFPFLLDLYAGMNQTYVSYGAGVDLLLFKVNAVAYQEESGSFVQQDPERRYQVSLEVKFPL